jgi:phage terminase small subunit
MTLTSRQSRFVEEYLVDLNGKQAAIRCGYSKVTAEAQASRLLRNVQVRVALEDALKARSKRTEVTADRVLNELAKIAFSNMKDYWPQPGERVDLSRLDEDRTAAIKEITIEEKVDRAGVLHRHIHLRLHDKIGALNSLARHLGLFTDRHVIENSIEYRVTRMTSEERLALVAEILEEGDRLLTMLTPEELVEIEPRQLAP